MTEQLPIPLSRADCYLATAAGMTGVILPADGPQSREEDYLAYMAGDTTIVLPTPGPLKEQWLAIICGDTSVTTPEIKGAFLIGQQMVRVEFLAKAAGVEGIVLPTNPNRTEQYFANIGGIVPDPGVLTQAKGTYIVLNNVLRGIDSLDYIYGDTYQQTYSGKNLYDATLSTTTENSVTYSADNEKIYVNGNATTNFGCNFKNMSLPAGTYTLTVELVSGSISSTSTGGLVLFTGTNVPMQQIILTSAAPKKSCEVNVSSDTTNAHIQIWARNTETFTNAVIKYQLVSGSTADYDFEPYVGGTASPNPDYPQDIQVVTGEQTVKVTGKNLFDYSLFDGITQNSDGTLKTTAYYTVTTVVSLHLKANTGYTLSIRNSDGELTGQGWGVAVNGTWINTTSGVGSVNTDANGDITLQIGASSYGAIGNWNSFIQLEQGNQPTVYEQFQSQDYTVNLKGKNLFDEQFGQGNYNNASDAGRILSIHSPKLVSGKEYTVSCSDITGYRYAVLGSLTPLYPGGGGTLAYDGGWKTSNTFTFTANGDWYIAILVSKPNNGNLTPQDMVGLNWQVEESEEATTYEPYYDYQLSKIDTYSDKFYKSNGNWYLRNEVGKIVLDGSNANISWSRTTTGTPTSYCYWFRNLSIGAKTILHKKYCEYFTYYPKFYNYDAPTPSLCENDNTNYPEGFMFIFKTDGSQGTTVDDWKTWLSNHNTTVYYVLATPTDTQITDSTLISELEALNSAILPSPDAFIQVTGNLAGEIEISYYAKSE